MPTAEVETSEAEAPEATETDGNVALVIPVKGPLFEAKIPTGEASLGKLQELVGGYIQALPVPDQLPSSDKATAYINEEGKFRLETEPAEQVVNRRATDFMIGAGLMPGDFIAGPFVLVGFDPMTGEHRELPQDVIDRARLIEKEAGL